MIPERFALKYPQFAASDALLRAFFGSDGRAAIPATFVFDASGRLRRAFLREIEETEVSALLDSLRDRVRSDGHTVRGGDALAAGKVHVLLQVFLDVRC